MKYKVLNGLNWAIGDGYERRAEPGEVCDDIPASDVAWLLEREYIEEVDETAEPGEPLVVDVEEEEE